jgi:hypothetical protein
LSAVVATSWASVWIRTGRLRPAGLLDGWDNMDVQWYVNIARFGYDSPEPGGNYAHGKPAFFPLLPALMRALHPVTDSWVGAGLLVSVSASLLVALLLWKLARELTDESVARDTLLLLFFSPFAIYLFVPYTEALFLAVALGVFLAMRRGHWGRTGLLCGVAVMARPSGAFLLAAVVTEFLVRRQSRGPAARPPSWLDGLLAVTPPAVCLVAWQTYLWAITGHWDAFSHAEAQVWHRHVVDPLTALVTTIDSAALFTDSWYLYYWVAEIAAVLLGFTLTVILARRREWSWAIFVGLNSTVLSLSSYYGSGSRAALTWFPAFVLLAIWMQKRPRLRAAYFAVSAPLMLVFVTSFTAGNWVA